jgi:coenzyme PQQ precursor peptide PqqA
VWRDQRQGRRPTWIIEEVAMKMWKTPRVLEITCGCEINAYFPAEL